MGKLRARKKHHHAAPGVAVSTKMSTTVDSPLEAPTEAPTVSNNYVNTPLLKQGNIFENLSINMDMMSRHLDQDVQSVKSLKSVKSESGVSTVSKKDKLKARREIFIQKLNATKTEKALSKKNPKKKDDAVFNTNPLNDALPSLESLMKAKVNVPYKQDIVKKKAIEKSYKQKKKQLQNINIYKQIMKNKQFEKDPFGAISSHIANIVNESNT